MGSPAPEDWEKALLLENQLCFPVMALGRAITRAYQPLLEALDLTYPQYLVLLCLWEEDGLTVGQISSRLLLETNTTTPLLKRMEAKGLVRRVRRLQDEREVEIRLGQEGREMKARAREIPGELVSRAALHPGLLESLARIRREFRTMVDIIVAERKSPERDKNTL